MRFQLSLIFFIGILFFLSVFNEESRSNNNSCPKTLNLPIADCLIWRANVLPEKPPKAFENPVADIEMAASLGMKIFYDNRFSKPGVGVSCATCHNPEHAFSEAKGRSHTIKEVARNAPDLLNAAWYTKGHFWDSRVKPLWGAPLVTFEQKDEMGSSRMHVVHTVAKIYGPRYEAVFGPLPDLTDETRFPEFKNPTNKDDLYLVDQIYSNVGKALEAYIRKLAGGRAPFDFFMLGSEASISASAKNGIVAATKFQCLKCHSGPTFTDENFHSLNISQAPGFPEDKGHDGGFRTPSLRNVAQTAPYGHNGTLATLEQAIDAHRNVFPSGEPMSAEDKNNIIEFLKSLNGRGPQPPWDYWPGGR